MPDVIVLEENGYTPNYFLSPSANFDGGIISTMIIVAVAEPTPIGEVILGGFALSLYLYQWAQVADAEFPNEACLDFFEECQRWNSFYLPIWTVLVVLNCAMIPKPDNGHLIYAPLDIK